MGKVRVIKPEQQKIPEQQKKKPRVCAYARVSTGTEEQANSYENQIKYWDNKFAQQVKNGEIEYLGVFADQAISGTTDKRPEFQRMIKKALNGEIDTIWTKNISRFSRNTADLLHYTQILEKAGVNVIFDETRIDGDEQLNLKSASGKIMITVLAAVAEMEVQNTSDHVKHTINAKMERGELVGQANPYGYDKKNGKLVINQDEAKWVKYIFERYINGYGGKSIARELTEKGVPTSRRAKKWNDSVIIDMIKNQKYMGTVVQGKTYSIRPRERKENDGKVARYVEDNACPAIIDEKTWKKAQQVLENRVACYKDGRKKGQRSGSHHYAFSDIVYCRYCGSKLTRRTLGRAHSTIPIWQCRKYIKEGKAACPHSRSIKEEDLERAFVGSLNEMLNNKTYGISLNVKKLEKVIKLENQSVRELEKDINKSERKIDLLKGKISKLVDMYMSKKIDPDTYNAKLEEFKKSIKFHENEIEDLETKREHAKNAVNEQEEIIKMISEEDVSAFNERILRALVERVEIGNPVGDEREISFFFKGSALTSDYLLLGKKANWTPPEGYFGSGEGAMEPISIEEASPKEDSEGSGDVEPVDDVIPKDGTTHVETVVRMTRADAKIIGEFSIPDNSLSWKEDEKGNRNYTVGEPIPCKIGITCGGEYVSEDNINEQ